MNSISPECQELKEQYDSCFHKWFSEKFLNGITKDDCGEIFEKYRQCVKKAIKDNKIDLWEIDRDILGTEHEKRSPPKIDVSDKD